MQELLEDEYCSCAEGQYAPGKPAMHSRNCITSDQCTVTTLFPLALPKSEISSQSMKSKEKEASPPMDQAEAS